MVSVASMHASKVLEKRGSESRSKGLCGEKSYTILLRVLPVFEEDVLLSEDCMRGSISGLREASSRA